MFARTLKNLFHILIDLAARFPIPVIFTFAFCFLSFVSFQHPEFPYIAFSGCFLFIAATLFTESHNLPRTYGWLVATGLLAIMSYQVIPWLSLTNGDCILTIYCASAFLSIFAAPYIFRTHDPLAFWQFCLSVLGRIGLTFLLTLILWLGLVALYISIIFLFGIKDYNPFYEGSFKICTYLIAPLFAMAGLPKKFDTLPKAYPKPLEIIVVYIAMPLLMAYALMLTIFALKIAFTFKIPPGILSWLVSGFAGASILIWLGLYPLAGKDNKYINFYHKYLLRFLLLPLILFGLATTTRILQYGFTEARYLLVVIFFCLTYITLIAYTGKPAKIFQLIYSLPIILFLIVTGPWGANAVSNYSQSQILRHKLENAGLLKGETIIPAQTELPPATLDEIQKIVKDAVLIRRQLNIPGWPQNFDTKYEPNLSNSFYSSRYDNMSNDFLKAYNLPDFQQSWKRKHNQPDNNHFYYMISRNFSNGINLNTLEVKGYDTLVIGQTAETLAAREHSVKTSAPRNHPQLFGFYGILDDQNDNLTLEFPILHSTLTIPTKEAFAPVIKANQENNSLFKTPIALIAENEQIKVKLIVNNIEGKKQDLDHWNLSNIQFDLLYTLKKPLPFAMPTETPAPTPTHNSNPPPAPANNASPQPELHSAPDIPSNNSY